MLVIALSVSLVFADQETYKLKVDGKEFDVSYSMDGELIQVSIDQESTSLLVGITNVKDSIFTIEFPSDLLSAQNSEFVVLVDGLETDYTITHGDNPTISFPIPADSEEIEIIGTSVIPEFPLGALATMAIVSIIAIIFSKTKTLSR